MPELRIQFCRLAVVATYEQPFGGSWQPLSWRTAERQALQHMPYEGISAKQGAASGCEASFWRSFLPGLDELDISPRFLEHAYV
jgi:hypothetical protein